MQQKGKKNQEWASLEPFDLDSIFKANLMTTPQNWNEDDLISQESGIVWLLNERIDKIIDWDFEKQLLWEESPNQEPFQGQGVSIEPQELEEAIKSEMSLQVEKEFYQAIQCQKYEVKTPQFPSPFEPLSPSFKVGFGLEKLQVKEEEKTGKCNCKKSRCLKMYCECFRAGKQCKDCGCVDCKNNVSEEDSRKKAIKVIKEKEPTAFTGLSQYKGCRCSKSQCLKGYCQCFLNGHICGKYCKCRDCLNCKNLWTSKALKTNKEPK